MDWLSAHAENVGFWAGTLTTASFAPQVIRTWRLGGDSLSWGMIALFGAGVGLWLLYGILRMSEPIMFANALTEFQVLLLAFLKVRSAVRDHRSGD